MKTVEFNIEGQGYLMGSTNPMGIQNAKALIGFFNSKPEKQTTDLGGRAQVKRFTLDPEGNLILKWYRRGGLLSKLIEQHYFSFGKSRAQHEFEFLVLAAKAGISVPVPIAFLKTKGPVYRAALVLKEIPQSQNLATFTKDRTEVPIEVIKNTRELLLQLIHAGIYHVDLHPGNILVDDQHRLYLIDFDKARIRKSGTKEQRKSLESTYRARWDRAIHKYKLPTYLLWDQIALQTPLP